MIFSSIEFLCFAAIFFAVFFFLRGTARLTFILTSSYFFYGWWDWRFLGLIMLSTVVDYVIGRWLGIEQDLRRRRALVFASILVNLGLLGFFKYFNFFAESLASATRAAGYELSWTTLNIVLPIGISFYTFQTLSYTIDVFRGKCATETNLLRFACFVSFFPQLVAGPIVRAASLLPQLRMDAKFDLHRAWRGLELIVWGFFLKIVLADTLGYQIEVDGWFSNPAAYGAYGHAVSVLFFSFQIYGDFAGYSLIAIGLGRIMGLDYGVNFIRPYFAATFSEFWQRWHISLSSWLRDYLYIPLGGSRHGTLKTMRNLFITMFLGGLWHGAAWNFVIWGLLHGGYLALWHGGASAVDRFPILQTKHLRYFMKIPLILAVFVLTSAAWIFFRAETTADAMEILTRILTFDQSTTQITTYQTGLAKGFLFIFVVVIIDLIAEFGRLRELYLGSPWLRAAGIWVAIWTIALAGTFTGSNFIYFQF